MSMKRVGTPRRQFLPKLVLCLLLISTSLIRAQSSNEVSPQVQQLYAEAKAAQQSGNDAAAIEKYQAIIKLAPHLAAAYNNLGMLYFNEQDFSHAATILERGLAVNPNMPTASAMLGMSYYQTGANERAEPLLKKALRASPSDDRIEMMLVHAQLGMGNFAEAVSHLNYFLKRNPRDQEAWYLLGKTYLHLSEDALVKINEIDPNSVVAHEISGEIDASMHNYELALVEYKKAIELAPGQPGTHMHMAEALWSQSKWPAAEDEFKLELANDPNNCVARWKLANSILEDNGSSDGALTELNTAVERCPTLMQARVDRARALVRLNKQPDALPDLLLAVKSSPKEPSIHFLLAAVYRAQGKSADAQAEMRTYADLQREAAAAIAAQASETNAIKSTTN
jgi:tetratricopeptide (TPR) repeat protein